MTLDAETLKNILRVNGLTPDSPPDAIKALLAGAGYSGSDVDAALTSLHEQTPPSIPAVPIPVVLSSMPPVGMPPLGTSEQIQTKRSFWDMFQGRVGVGGYWKANLFLIGITIFVYIVAAVLILGAVLLVTYFNSSLTHGNGSSVSSLITAFLGLGVILGVLGGILGVCILILTTGLQIRRLHDVGLTGWVIVISWVIGIVSFFGRSSAGFLSYSLWAKGLLVLNFVFWLYVLLWPGKKVANKYGPFITYRSMWSALIGTKNPYDTTTKRHPGISGVITVFGILGALALLGIVLFGVFALVTGKLPTSGAGQSVSITPSGLGTNPILPSFQIPAGFTKTQDNEQSDFTEISYSNTLTPQQPHQVASFSVFISPLTTDDTPQSEADSVKDMGGTNLTEKPITVSGVSGIEVQDTIGSGANAINQTNIYVAENGNTYTFLSTYALSYKAQYAAVLDAMLASIQLPVQATSSTPAPAAVTTNVPIVKTAAAPTTPKTITAVSSSPAEEGGKAVTGTDSPTGQAEFSANTFIPPTSPTPTISGTATGVTQLRVVVSDSEGYVKYDSGLVPVTSGQWSVTVSPPLTSGQYFINVDDSNGYNLVNGGFLNVP